MDDLDTERQAKLAQLTPDEPSVWERRLSWVHNSRLLSGLLGDAYGFRVRLGGLAQPQGFALGPMYTRTDLWNGRLALRTSLRGSTRKAYLADFGVTVPRLASGKGFVDLYAVHYDYPNMHYYGQGRDRLAVAAVCTDSRTLRSRFVPGHDLPAASRQG